jgi:hypothetical protein
VMEKCLVFAYENHHLVNCLNDFYVHFFQCLYLFILILFLSSCIVI